MHHHSTLPLLIGLCLFVGCAAPAAKPARTHAPSAWSLESTPLDRSAAELSNQAAEHLAWAEALRDRILEARGARTIANTLDPYNEMAMHLDAVAAESSLFARVHPDASVRAAAEQAEQDVQKFVTALKLDRRMFEAFQAVNVDKADAPTKYLVLKALRDFRRAGVDKDDVTRGRVAALNDEIVKLGQAFAKNTRDDEREITLSSASQLEGLPRDWIDKHQPGPDGTIRVSTRYPDYYPFVTYSRDTAARASLYREFKNRGYPKNIDVLKTLLERRHELARLLGYNNYADYITEDKMIGSAANARSFIDRVSELSRAAAERDYHVLLERKRKDDPSATKVEDHEKAYYEELVKSEQYAFDAQAVRPYFNFPDVQKGLFDLTGKLFGVSYRPVHGLKLWHEDVTAWEVMEGDRMLGRFYLDLHPRKDKYGHAAQFDYRTGIEGKRLPQSVLVCNFPNPRDSKDGLALMEHDEVVTFFHEFGHLLHAILAGHQRWMGNAGISTEWDFVEAPSQMLEEWCFDTASLRSFALHHQSREPIPTELVDKLRKARDFGKGLFVSHQMFYAAVSLDYYDRDPKGLDTTALARELQDKYSAFDYVPETHFECGFGHLDGYSAIYYTYMWSLVLAKDMFSEFEAKGLYDRRTSWKYRDGVLGAGGSAPAAELVNGFLCRPYSFDAFERWINRM